jgi:hypothetical protein
VDFLNLSRRHAITLDGSLGRAKLFMGIFGEKLGMRFRCERRLFSGHYSFDLLSCPLALDPSFRGIEG